MWCVVGEVGAWVGVVCGRKKTPTLHCTASHRIAPTDHRTNEWRSNMVCVWRVVERWEGQISSALLCSAALLGKRERERQRVSEKGKK